MSRRIDLPDLYPLAIGAAILGAGGGGDPYVGRMMAEKAMRATGPVTLLDVAEVPDGSWVIAASGVGAPTILYEKIPSGREAAAAVQRLAMHIGVETFAICAAEAGGVNSMIPLIAAAQLGVPVVDADGMGRAFPGLFMETFHIYGMSGTPACFASEHGDLVLLDRLRDNYAYEWLARGVTMRLGGHAFVADYPMTGKDLRQVAIPGTLQLALEIGRSLLEAQSSHADPVEAVCAAAARGGYGSGLRLFTGKVVDVLRRTTDGLARGTITVQGSGPDAGSVMRIDVQNENILAARDGLPICTVPDLVCVLDAANGLPISTERLRYGYRVTVLGIPAPDIMKTAPALEIWGPRAFGYDFDYFPPTQTDMQA